MPEKDTFIDKLGRVVTKVGVAFMTNVLFLICCIPVVTIGQAWCALLTSVRYQIRGDSWWDGFKYGFKTRFWRGTLVWCIMLPVDILLLWHAWSHILNFTENGVISPVGIFGILVFLMMLMLTAAFLTLNVYIPTKVGQWINNATSMVFKAPLQLMITVVLVWLPVVLIPIFPGFVYYFLMVFLVVYYTLVAFGSTLMLKRVLMDYLVAARADGTLLVEEGRQRDPEESDGEENEEE